MSARAILVTLTGWVRASRPAGRPVRGTVVGTINDAGHAASRGQSVLSQSVQAHCVSSM